MFVSNRAIRRCACLAVLAAAANSPASPATAQEVGPASCGGRTFGTSISWAETTDAALEQARREDKLVLVVQLSGNFTKTAFT